MKFQDPAGALSKELLDQAIGQIDMMRDDLVGLRRCRNPRLPVAVAREIVKAISDAELAINGSVGQWEKTVALQTPL